MENKESNEEIQEQKNFDEKVKLFFADKKNTAITILSILVIVFAYLYSNATTSTSTTISDESTQAMSDLSVQLEEANAKIATLENNNQELSKNNEDLTNRLNSVTSTEELERTIDEKNQYILNLEEQLGIVTAEKSQLDAQIGILQQQLSSVAPATSSNSGNASTSSSRSNSYTVYVTNTGGKYHSSGCSYLRSSKIAIEKDNAISQGYTACSRCNP